MSVEWLYDVIGPVKQSAIDTGVRRQAILTKPPGALGRLEQVAINLCGLLGETPNVDELSIVVFAGDHGVAEEGVSAFPQVVTGEMIKNFASGGAAICVLARELNARLEVVNMGTVNDPGDLPGVVNIGIAPSSNNLCKAPAMTNEQLNRALNAGRDAALRAVARKANLFIGGDMGIANTTSATALGCAYMGLTADDLVGPGTGLDAEGVAHKASVIDQALSRHRSVFSDPVDVLRCLGGFEIAALVGAYVTCAQSGVPILIDGFIASSAALAAIRISPDVVNWLFLSHASAEPGHKKMTQEIGLQPLLDLQMRLGEGSGAAVAVPLLRMACRLHNEMATFEQAGVSES